jgi:short-subunit dehydrogenase
MDRPVALITGASAGIGAALAQALAQDHDLVLVARRQERLEALATTCRAAAPDGGRVHVLVADLADCDEAQLVRRALEAAGRLDALVLNAGIFTTCEVATTDAAHIDHLLRLNLRHPMLLGQAALPELRRRRGVVVAVSSIAATDGFPACGVYGATKAGLEAWAMSLRAEERAAGLRVSVVAPGPTDTEVWPEDCPFDRSRMSSAEDIAAVIAHCVRQPASIAIERIRVTPPAGSL